MHKIAVCFTRQGEEVIEKLNAESRKKGIAPVTAYVCREGGTLREGFLRVSGSIAAWTETVFLPENALIFVGAAGIAVRAVAALAADKLSDCPVLVIDDAAQFVIPILSGHAGGANKLAAVTAALLGAVPVITTSTDVNEAFSVDSFAVENRLTIANREGIKRISAKALEGKAVTLSIRDFPPQEPVDVVVAEETDAEYTLLLKPKKYTVGLGMKKGRDKEAVEAFFLEELHSLGITPDDVYALCTIDLKEEEPALLFLRDRYRIPVLSFDREILEKVQGSTAASDFVKQVTGVENVCERAALAGAGALAQLVSEKKAKDGMTIAVAKKP